MATYTAAILGVMMALTGSVAALAPDSEGRLEAVLLIAFLAPALIWCGGLAGWW